MLRVFVLWTVVLATLGFGVVGFAESSSDGTVSYGDVQPEQLCQWHYAYDCGPWHCWPSHQECPRTWRCAFFFRRGCYQISMCYQVCDVYRQWCCEWNGIWHCDPWEYYGEQAYERREHEFLECYCTGVSGGMCVWD